MPQPSTAPLDFEADFRETMDRLRRSLTECLSALQADPGSPRALGRQLELDKSLAWKVAQLARPEDTDTVRMARQLPGPAGCKLVLEALRRAEAPVEPRQRLEEAFERFGRLVQVHGGNRAGLDVLLASLSAGSPDARGMENSRKQAFQGTSAMWGVQVRMRLGLHIVTPSEDPERVTLATVAGLYDFRRLRAEARWPLIQIHDFGTGLGEAEDFVSFESGVNDGTGLLRDFCSENLPPLELAKTPHGFVRELREGPLGRAGAHTFVFAHLRKAFAPLRGEQPGEFGEHLTVFNTPAERGQVDLLLHRDLPFPGEPSAKLYSKLETGAQLEEDPSSRYELPVAETLRPLPGDRPTLATPHVPRYTELVDSVLDRLGTPLEEFRAWRFSLQYPPIPTVAAVRHDLAPPADA